MNEPLPDGFDDVQLADCTSLAELLTLTLLLIALYGEDAPVRFDAGYNNVGCYMRKSL